MDFVLSVKYFREDLWSRTFYSVLKWRHESGTVGATPGDKTQSIQAVSGEQFKQDYTDKCSFIRIHVISPDIWRQLCFTRGGEHFLFVQRAVVFVILGPTHPTPHLIWCPPFPGIIQKTNLTLTSPWSSLSDKHSSVFSPNVNRHYPPTWHWSALIIPWLPPLLSSLYLVSVSWRVFGY